MNTQTLEVEIVQPVDDKLVKYAGETGLEKQSTETLVEAFRPIFAKSRAALADARGVAESVKDATCVREIMRSRACRLALRSVRLESDEARKKHKQHALLYGKAVDGFHNILLADLSPVETALKEAEDFAELAEAARLAALRAAREAELVPLLDEPLLGNLADLSEADYMKKLSNAKLLRNVKLAEAAKIEADRLAKQESERAERERLAAENARLQAEAVARESAAKAEREAAEKKLADERAEAARVAADIKAKADADAKAATDQAAKERAAWEKKRKEEQAAAEAKAKADREAAAELYLKELAEREALAKVELAAMASRAKAAKEESDRLAKIARKEREMEIAKRNEAASKALVETNRLKAELAAKEKVEADAAKRVESDRLAAEAAAKKAAAAPDKAKLLAFADVIAHIETPSFADEQIYEAVRVKVRAFASWCAEQAARL